MSVKSDEIIKPRSPFNAVLLSLCMSGLGHVYCGRLVAGLVWASVGAVAGVISLGMLASGSLAISWIPMVATQMVSAIHARAIAKQCPAEYRLESWNRWWVYVLLACLCSVGGLGHGLVVRDQYVEAFVIASNSMSPTLRRGERILVDKTAYRSSAVKAGDVVVFANPEKPSMTYIKRVVALSGDRVEILDGRLQINGEDIDGSASKTTPDFGPMTVPDYNCFVLGDDIDDSKDSRHFGPVPLATVGGRATVVYWPPFRQIHTPGLPAEVSSTRDDQP
ncbi:MAG: signal peptidase I [Planctomycetota bacterium]